MSTTYAALTTNIRRRLHDTNLNSPVFNTVMDIYRTITVKARDLAGDAQAQKIVLANAFTSTPLSLADQALPSTLQYDRVMEIRDTLYGRLLLKRDLTEVTRMRDGIKAGIGGMGDPIIYGMYEGPGSIVYVRWNLVPSRAISYDILYGTVPATTVTDGTQTIDFSDSFLPPLEAACALSLWASASPDQLQRLGLSGAFVIRGKLILPPFAQDLQQEVTKGVQDERFRQAKLARSAVGGYAVVSGTT